MPRRTNSGPQISRAHTGYWGPPRRCIRLGNDAKQSPQRAGTNKYKHTGYQQFTKNDDEIHETLTSRLTGATSTDLALVLLIAICTKNENTYQRSLPRTFQVVSHNMLIITNLHCYIIIAFSSVFFPTLVAKP